MTEIVEAMNLINGMDGEDSVVHKVTYISSLLKLASTDDELRYLVRSFANQGLRIGLSTKTVENVIHEQLKEDEKSLAMFEKDIFGYRLRNLTELESNAIYHVPIKPMIGKAAKSATDVLQNLNKKVEIRKLTSEFKYDGERT